jgi:hypothetical protein
LKDQGQKTVYRILTENKNIDLVKATLGRLAIDYTLYFGEGGWKGCPESSIIIELVDTNKETAESIARSIKAINDQEAIMLQELPIASWIV